MALSKQDRRFRIKRRIRKNICGIATKPRLSVFRSNKHISVQIIDDLEGKTLVNASSQLNEFTENKDVSKIKQASLVGKLIAEKAIKCGITSIVFDRNGYLYHGRIKALAEAARKGGLKF